MDSEIRPGMILGEYSIERVLAEGNMATVYVAVHPIIGKRVAIKVMSERLSHDEAAVEAFRAEARAVNEIRHPGLVDVFSFGSLPDQRSYYVMEWLEGESLGSRLRRGRLTLGESCDILIQVCDALAAAHAQHIVHLDLKPDNVFLLQGGASRTQVKLLDFGIAKHFRDGARPHDSETQMEVVCGTPAYLSPEQALGREVDQRSDCYSFGVMAFEMLLGGLPFMADSIRAMFTLHVKQPPPRPRSMWPDIPPILEQLLLGLLAKDPRKRPALSSARSCLVGLRDVSLQVRTVLSRPATMPHTLIGHRRGRKLLMAAALGLLIGGAGWTQLGRRPALAFGLPPAASPGTLSVQVTTPACVELDGKVVAEGSTSIRTALSGGGPHVLLVAAPGQDGQDPCAGLDGGEKEARLAKK